MSRRTSTMLVAGRMVPKNLPCACPTASQSSMLSTYIRVRTDIFQLRPQAAQGDLDVFQRSNGLRIGVALPDDTAIVCRGRRARHEDKRTHAHGTGITHDRFPGRSRGRSVRAFTSRYPPPAMRPARTKTALPPRNTRSVLSRTWTAPPAPRPGTRSTPSCPAVCSRTGQGSSGPSR